MGVREPVRSTRTALYALPFIQITGSFRASIGKIAVVAAATGEDTIDSSHSRAAEEAGQEAVNPNIPVQSMRQPPPQMTDGSRVRAGR